MLNCKELIEYLSQFESEAPVAVVIADFEKRLAYHAEAYQLIKHEVPTLLFELGSSAPLNDAVKENDSLS